jgi:SAM-dependent methyltransferase
VSLLRELGFDAIGIDLSPWVVEFARETFGVSVLQGTLETLDLEPGFTCVAALDVLEHLADPLDTMRRCARLLAADGVLLLQTPCYRGEGPDWSMFQRDEHIYLFTEASVRDLLGRTGFKDIRIRSSFFPYDMWIAATPGKLTHHWPVEGVSLDRRLPTAFRALLDLSAQTNALRRSLAEAEADRAERLRQIDELTAIARKAEADRIAQVEEMVAQVEDLTRLLQESEADRIAQVEELTRLLQESEADRAARLEVIHGAEAQISALHAEIEARQSRLERIEHTAVWRVYRTLAREK